MEILETMFDELGKLGLGFLASVMSYHFGGDAYLLLLVQYLFFIDFVVGIIDANKANKFSWGRFWFGLKKIANLYLILIIVGLGTKSHDVTFTGKFDTVFNGVFFFNLLVYILIIFELSSINRHLARLNFPLCIQFENIFDKLMLRVAKRLEGKLEDKIDEASDKFDL